MEALELNPFISFSEAFDGVIESPKQFEPWKYFENIDKIITKNNFNLWKSYELAKESKQEFDTIANRLVKDYERVPTHYIETSIRRLARPITFIKVESGYPPSVYIFGRQPKATPTNKDVILLIQNKLPVIDKHYTTLYEKEFDHVRFSFYCGHCKKVVETYFAKMPHPCVRVNCPACLEKELIPIPTVQDQYRSNEYYPLQIEGVVLGVPEFSQLGKRALKRCPNIDVKVVA